MTDTLLMVILVYCGYFNQGSVVSGERCLKSKLECALPAYELKGAKAVKAVAECLK